MSIEKKIKIVVDASAARKQIDSLRNRLGGVTGATGRLTKAQEKHARQQHRLNKSMIDTNRSLNAMAGLMRKVAAAAAVFTGIRLADDFNELQNKLRITLKTGERLIEVQTAIVDISLRTRSSLQENSLLYLRLANAVDRFAVSQNELLSITETVNQAVQLGGSSAQEASGAVRQFTQIVASGFSSGFSQEINSISEQTPGLFKVIADGMRETSEEFRELEESGLGAVKILKIFSEKSLGDLDTLLKAIASQADKTNKAFETIVPTVAKSFLQIRTALEVFIGKIDDATGLTTGFALSIEQIALNFDEYANKLAIAVAGMVVAIATFKTLTAVVALTSLAVFGLKNAFTALAASKSLKFIALMALKGGAIFLLHAAILAISVAVGIMVVNLVKTEGSLIKVGEKSVELGELLRATFKVIKDRIKDFSANMGIARDNTLIVMNNIGEAIVGTFEQIAIAMNSDESSFTKFFLKTIPETLARAANYIIRAFVIVGKFVAGALANIFLDSQALVEKAILSAEKNYYSKNKNASHTWPNIRDYAWYGKPF